MNMWDVQVLPLAARSIQPQAVPLGAALLRLRRAVDAPVVTPAALATPKKSTLLRIGLGVTRHPE